MPDPGDRDVWLHPPKQSHGRSGLLDQSRLRQTCAQDAMPGGTSGVGDLNRTTPAGSEFKHTCVHTIEFGQCQI
jgi:hypothetical protein